MKKLLPFFSILLLTTFTACEVNQSTSKNLITGVSSRGDGLSCEDVIIQVNGETESRNEFVYGENVEFIFSDIYGFQKEDGKDFPGLSMYIVHNEKDTVLAETDLFADLTEGVDFSPLQLTAKFIAKLSFDKEDKYITFIKVWDKKGTGTFSYEFPFVVKENTVLTVKPSELNADNIYLWNETKKQMMVNNTINKNETIILLVEKPTGLKEIDGRVYPQFSIHITDENDTEIVANDNVLAQYEANGIDAKDVPELQLSATFKFDGTVNPVKLHSVILDKTTGNKINISTTLEVE